MKTKTHSGAKKRLRQVGNGKVKRGQTRMRHLLSHMSSKTKRHLDDTSYVHGTNMGEARRLLVF